jgi:hypothetical protein
VPRVIGEELSQAPPALSRRCQTNMIGYSQGRCFNERGGANQSSIVALFIRRLL